MCGKKLASSWQGHSESGSAAKNSAGQSGQGECVPMVVPSRACADEVMTLKQGDLYIGRGSKQRNLLPSFWANRYNVHKFGRRRAVELHKAEVNGDPQYGRRIHDLSGIRGSCVIASSTRMVTAGTSKTCSEGFTLARSTQPVPIGHRCPASSTSLPRHVKNGRTAKSQVSRTRWPMLHKGAGNPMVIGSGYAERRLCDGQGLCSPGTWAPEDRTSPVRTSFGSTWEVAVQ